MIPLQSRPLGSYHLKAHMSLALPRKVAQCISKEMTSADRRAAAIFATVGFAVGEALYAYTFYLTSHKDQRTLLFSLRDNSCEVSFPESRVISMGRRNTRTNLQVALQRLRSPKSTAARKKPSCSGKSELQPQGFGLAETLSDQMDKRGVASTG